MTTPENSRGLVLITGGSGYIAGYCIAELQSQGWRVRATIRNLAKAEAVRASLASIAPKAGEIEFVAADLNSDLGWAAAAAGCDYVLHVASPIPLVDPKSDDELVRPARDGTLRVLKAARDAGVKRVVSTSSVAAIMYGQPEREKPFTEADWTDESNVKETSPYERSKTIAERASWAWLKAEGGNLELATVNPVLVLGPVLGSDFSASLEAVRKLMDGSAPAIPRFGFGVVDVRDLAKLHLAVMTSPAAAGERFIASADFLWMKEIAAILKEGLGPKGRKVPTIPAPDFLVRGLALFDPAIRGRIFELGKRRVASSEKARRMLGWTTRPVKDTLLDAARSLQAHGLALNASPVAWPRWFRDREPPMNAHAFSVLTICGLEELDNHSDRGVSHVLSILDPGWPEPEAFWSFDPHMRVTLHFNDDIEPRPGIVLPEKADIEKILAFGRDLGGDLRHLLIHCHAGVSRSTAAMTMILAQAFPLESDEAIVARLIKIRPQAWPNSRMIGLADEILGRKLIEPVSRIYARRLAAHPDLGETMRRLNRAREVELGMAAKP